MLIFYSEAPGGVLLWLDEGIAQSTRRGAYIHWDKVNRVLNCEDQNFVGTVDEEFALESAKGDVFYLATILGKSLL